MDYTERVATTGQIMVCPVRLGLKKNGSDLWTLPLEPEVSLKMKKTIVHRNIAKSVGTGTVKEAFSLDDYDITISGMLQSSEDEQFPEEYLSKLQTFLKPMQAIYIQCKLLDMFGIQQMVIESADFPHTAGIANQSYTITGSSDQYFDLT